MSSKDNIKRRTSDHEKALLMRDVLKQLYESPTRGNNGKGPLLLAALDIQTLAAAIGLTAPSLYRFLDKATSRYLLETYGVVPFNDPVIKETRYIYNPQVSQINPNATLLNDIPSARINRITAEPIEQGEKLTDIERLILTSFFEGHYKTILEGNDNDKELVNKTITNALTDKSFAIKLVKVESNES